MLPAQKMATLTVGDRAAAPAAGCGHFLPPRRHETQATKGEEKPSCGLVSGAKCVLQGQVWLHSLSWAPRCWWAVWGCGRLGLPMIGEAPGAAPRATSTHLRPEERQVGLSPGTPRAEDSAVCRWACGSSPKTWLSSASAN